MGKYVRKGYLTNENVGIVEVCSYSFSVVLDLSYEGVSIVYAKTIIPRNFCEILGVKEVAPFHPTGISQEFMDTVVGNFTEVGIENGKVCFGWKAKFDDGGNVVGADVVEWKVSYKSDKSEAEISEPEAIGVLPEELFPELKRLLAKKYGKQGLSEVKYLTYRNPLAQLLMREYLWLKSLTFDVGYNLTVVPLYINSQIFGAKVVWKNAVPVYFRRGVKHENELRYITKEDFEAICY